ncbi:MAG: response regulator [Myxococcales bacterium]
MPKHNLLVADPDPRSLRLLELALRRAGFGVATASDGGEALRRIQRASPGLVLADVALPTQDGFTVCRTVRASDRFGTIPILLMSSDRDPGLRVRAGEAGADDFLEKPILVKDLVEQVRELLSERASASHAARSRATPAALSGSVSDLGLVDLFNSLETWQKSAVVHCEDGERTARVWVRNGQVVDAEVESLQGEAAFYRLLGWESGTFRVEFGQQFHRAPRTELGTQALLLEGMRRIDEAARLSDTLPPGTVFGVDFDVLGRRLVDLPDEVNGVLRLIDGRRTLREVIGVSPLDDLSTLAIAQRLLADGIVRKEEQPVEEAKKPSLEQWLGSEPLAPPKVEGASLPEAPPSAPAPEVPEPVAEVAEEVIPGPPPPDLRIAHYGPVGGVRRERLRVENETARAEIAAGRPVRLTRIEEMPPAPDGSDAVSDETRHASDAVGDAAQRFAPDSVIARIVPWGDQRWRTWTPAEKDGGISPLPPQEGAVAASPVAEARRPEHPMEERALPATGVGRRPEHPIAGARLLERDAAPRVEAPARVAAPQGAPSPLVRQPLQSPAARPGRRWVALAAVACIAAIAIAFAIRPWRGPTVSAPAPAPVAETQPAPQAPPPVQADAPAEPAPQTAAPAPPSPAEEYARTLREGEALLKRGRYRAAAQELRKAVQIDGKSVPALLALGDALLEADEARNALPPLRQAAELDPRSARAQLLLGTAYQSLNRKSDALKAYRRYLELDPQGEVAGDVRAILANLGRQP